MSGTQPSAFSNQLFNIASGATAQALQQNELANRQTEQTIGAQEIEVMARVASTLMDPQQYPTPEARAAAYPRLVGLVQAQGYGKQAPASYPGDEHTAALARLGTSSADLYKQRGTSESVNSYGATLGLGDGGTAPPAPTGAAPTAAPAPTAATPEAPTAPPALTSISSPGGAKLTVSTAAAPRFQGLIDDLEKEGYKLDPGTTGGYNDRNIAGTNTKSHHAGGNAVDLNWQRNARGTQGDIPPELARRLAAKHGLKWGGDWSGETRDPMHFEVADAPSGGGAPGRIGGGSYDVAGQPTAAPGRPAAAPAAGPALDTYGLTAQDRSELVQLQRGLASGRIPGGVKVLQDEVQQRRAFNIQRQDKAQTDAVRAETLAMQRRQEAREIVAATREQAKFDQEQLARNDPDPYPGKTEEAADMNKLIRGSREGGDPSTLEYANSFARQAIKKTEFGISFPRDMSMFKTPTYKPADDAAPGGRGYGQTPIRVGPDPTMVRKMETEAAPLFAALDALEKQWNEASAVERAETIAGKPTPLMTAWTNAALLAKGDVLFRLGVLNGPDLSVMNKAMANPSTFFGSLTSADTATNQLKQIRNIVQVGLDAQRNYGQPKKPDAGALAAPPGAIEHLRQNPSLAGAFDQKYGAGAAKRALGQ